jgi:alpha-tubulin suppressor-like RCC1 family protein
VAKCWGSNDAGQLGINSRTNSSSAVSVWADSSGANPLSGISAISAGDGLYGYTCAATKTGSALCWGENWYGELGTGSFETTTNDSITIPTNVLNLNTTISDITTGFSLTCALTTTGTVKCWGENSAGSVGIDPGTTVKVSSPVDVAGLSDIRSVSAGAEYACAISGAAGNVLCWGIGQYGILGNSSSDVINPIPIPTPVFVQDALGNHLASAAAISTSSCLVFTSEDQHTCVITTAGAVKCWGTKIGLQFGTSNQAKAVDVALLP